MSAPPHSTEPDNPRPLKKARKAPQEHYSPTIQDSQNFDHIFIAEGNVKKQPTKKPPLSCAECRRLKLRCDRIFPCKSCSKRGCADICPQGVLVSGKGTRFILANTEQLHAKISQMSDRIRQLEDALQVSQSSCSPDPHPLLEPELLIIKSALTLYGDAQTGTSQCPESISPPGDAQERVEPLLVDPIVGDQASSNDTSEKGCQSQHMADHEAHDDQLPAEILRLSYQFPLGESVSPDNSMALRLRVRRMLPPRPEASYLWEQVRQNALWQYNPHPSETFMPNLLHHAYDSALDELCPRRLALLLMILAVGCLVDLNQPSDCPDAEKYHHLARASLCEIPIMEDTNIDAIVALFYMTWYLLVFSDKKKAAGHAWGLMGLTAKLAQSIGLHRDSIKSKVIPEEVEKRRALFWELMYLDARLSLSLGRPPSLYLSHTDCQRPSYGPDESYSNLGSFCHYQEWKHSCYIHCLSPVLEVISSPTLEYTTVIELDKTIRNFYIPPIFRSSGPLSRPLAMQKASLSTALEAVLLQLHRSFFTRALSGPEEGFNRRHKYAPSVVAIFLSASRMIATVERLFRQEPELSARILWYWSNAFSAAVALCLLVSRAPFTCLSPAALQELERARVLFSSAKDRCPRALQVVPMLETMVEKANHIYARWSSGQDVSSLVLRHSTDDANDQDSNKRQTHSATDYVKVFMSEQPTPDSFAQAHPSLSQCITEVHQRALSLFPLRKPCQCSARTTAPCPPSHSWSPLPEVKTPSPVLPDLYTANFAFGVLCSGTPKISRSSPPLHTTAILPASRMAVVDTLNFDFGALNPSWNDQSWMAWF